MRHSRAFFSNTFEELSRGLAEDLFSSFSPFARPWIIVENLRLKDYLIEKLATDLGVFSGIRIIHADQAVRFSLGVPSQTEIAIKIESAIYNLLKEPEDCFKSLIHYLQDDENGKKILPLCDMLARGFERRYISQKEGFEEPWHEAFYVRCAPNIFQSQDELSGPIYVFGCDFLPKKFLDNLCQKEAFFYCLSPCSLFWEDLCSDKQRAFRKSFLNPKEQAILDEYFKDQNPLLANWGKLGRLCARNLEERGVLIEDRYIEETGTSSISVLRRNLLKMEKHPYEKDMSIQVHSVSSIREEVELAFQQISALINKESLRPSDVLIMAQDISVYAPFIHMIFGSNSSSLDYKIYDLKEKSIFSDLFDFAFERFTPEAFFRLCKHREFLEKNVFSEEEVELLHKWASKAPIVWGVDKEQRQLFFTEPLCDAQGIGTWEHGFDRLFKGLVHVSSEEEPFIELHESEVLGRWILLVRALKKDLEPFIDGKERTLSAWCKYTQQLVYNRFTCSQELIFFTKKLQELLCNLDSIQSTMFSLHSFYRLIEPVMQKSGGGFQTNHLESVSFCSYTAAPAKIIYLLGMDEESFPRREQKNTFDLPSKTDKDHYLFLKWILCAQQYLILSYQRKGDLEGQREFMNYLGLEQNTHLRYARPKKERVPMALKRVEDVKIKKYVHVRHLEELAKHPIRFYLRQVVRLSLSDPHKASEFEISARIKKRLLKQCLEKPFEEVWAQALSCGDVPEGVFGKLLYRDLESKVELRKKVLKEWGVEKIFSARCIPSQEIPVEGKIFSLSDKGMIVEGKANMQNFFKIWPAFLVFLLSDFGEKRLLFIDEAKVKGPVIDPKKAFHLYMEYYTKARQEMSFFMPEWSMSFFKGNEVAESSFRPFYDPYIDFLERRDGKALSPRDFFSEWKDSLHTWFAPFLEWCSYETL